MATADATRMSESRARARDLTIPSVFDPKRRAACEADDCEWLRVYLPGVFYNPFTDRQKRTIEACGAVMRYGTKKCTADERGGGKSSTIKYLALKYALGRQLKFPLAVAATHKKAGDILDGIKRHLSLRTISPLSQDYPVECAVARYVNPWPSRARNVTANGRRVINVEWGADTIILPTFEDEEPLGPILRALSITSDDLQGCNIYDIRPDFVLLDDLDSRDSLASEDGKIAGKIEETIDKTIAGMAGQSRSLGIYMLCTITSRKSAAFKYSDPTIKPAYDGERIAAILAWPERADLWKEYIELRQWGTQTRGEDGRAIDPFGRKAHQHYLDNDEVMNAGAELSNPFNFNATILPDGSQQQVSSLQRCYDYIADHGMASFQTEHQNDPPEDEGTAESGINQKLVQTQMSGVPRGVIPDGCTVLTHTCDVGKLKGFNWVVRAFKPDGTGYTIDYGTMDVRGARWGTDEGLDRALFDAVKRRMDEFTAADYRTAAGDKIPDKHTLSLFDARWQTDAICSAVKSCGLGVKAFMGIGASSGCVKGRFRDVTVNSSTRRKCGTDGAYEELKIGAYGKLWVVHADTDRWKEFEHSRWMTATDRPGCMFLFGTPTQGIGLLGEDERVHVESQYAKHIVSEILAEVEHKGALVRKFISKSSAHDYLDASYMGHVAAAMLGIRILGAVKEAVPPSSRPTAAQLAGRV
jgi:hypothetical protein